MTTAEMLIKIRADVGSALIPINALKAEFASFSSIATAALPASLALGAAGAAVTAGFASAAKNAADFQTTMTNVRNNTNMSAQDTNTLSQAVLAIGANSGAGFDQLAEGGKKAMNITGNMATSLQLLDVAQKSAVSTGANVAQVTNVLANAMHEYGVDVGNTAQVHQQASVYMGMMHQAAAMSNMDLQDFAANSGRAIGIAANLGVPLQEIAAGYVGLTKHGFDAAGAQVQLVDAMTHMISPTAQQIQQLGTLSRLSGVDLVSDFDAQTLSTKGLVGVMADITQAYKNTGFSQAQAEGETMKLMHALRGGLGLGTLLGTGAEDYAKALVTLSDTTAMATLTDDSFARTQETLNNHLDVLHRRVELVGKAIGSALLPPIASAVAALSDLASAFMALPSWLQATVTWIGAGAGAFLSVAGAIGVAAWTLGPLAVGFKAMGFVVASLGSTATVAAAEVATLTGAEVATGDAAVIATVKVGGLRGALSALAGSGLAVFGVLGAAAYALSQPLRDALDILYKLRDAASAIPDAAMNPVQRAVRDALNKLPQNTSAALPAAVTVPVPATAPPQPSVQNALQADTAKKKAIADAKDTADAALKVFTDAADKRKASFEIAHVDAETGVLQAKLDANIAEHDTLKLKQAIEDLDRNAVDYAQKRLQLDEQDAVTRAKIAESGLKAKADDNSYQQQLLLADAKAARKRGETVDMHAMHQQIKDLKNAAIQDAPALLRAQHGVTVADRTKSGTDLTASLVTTALDRQKLALEEANAPMAKAAALATRLSTEAAYQLDLDRQRFAMSEQAYVTQKLKLEAMAKEKDLAVWFLEHPVATAADHEHRGSGYVVPGTPYDPARAHDVWPGGTPIITSQVGEVHIHVNGGQTGTDTIENIKNAIGGWFQQAVDRAGKVDSGAVRRQLGGAYGT